MGHMIMKLTEGSWSEGLDKPFDASLVWIGLDLAHLQLFGRMPHMRTYTHIQNFLKSQNSP